MHNDRKELFSVFAALCNLLCWRSNSKNLSRLCGGEPSPPEAADSGFDHRFNPSQELIPAPSECFLVRILGFAVNTSGLDPAEVNTSELPKLLFKSSLLTAEAAVISTSKFSKRFDCESELQPRGLLSLSRQINEIGSEN